MKVREDIERFEDVQSEEDLLPLGTKGEILALLKKWFPEADFHDPSMISFDGRGELTEIIVSGADKLDDNGIIDSIGFRNPSYRVLRDVCTKMGWKAVDEGDFFDFDSQPSENSSQTFVQYRVPTTKYGLTDLIIYLRNQVLETWIGGNKSELSALAITLQILGDSFSKFGDGTFWTVVDNLAYFAKHAEFADYTLYVPTEEAIRGLESK